MESEGILTLSQQRLGLAAGLAIALTGCRFFKTGSSCATGPGLSSTELDGSGLQDSQLVLTFDGGPTDATREISDYLYGNLVQATFFVAGKDAERRPDELKLIKERGHLIANLGFSGQPLHEVADPVLEVRKTDELIAPYVTGDMFIFRSPDGALDDAEAKQLNEAGLSRYVGPIRWDIGDTIGAQSSESTSDKDCWDKAISIDDCAERYLKAIRLKKHGIVRLHAERLETSALLKVIVPKLVEEKFTFLRLDAVPAVKQALEQSGGKPGAVGGGAGCHDY